MRLADYVANRLSEVGVNTVYLVTGRGSLFLTDAVARHEELDFLALHHEQSVGYAAVADSEVTGGFSAAMVSTGCGSTNAITAVLTAWQDEVPAIFISGQNTLAHTTYFSGESVRTFGEQETNIVELVKPITKFAQMLTDASDIRRMMDEALYLAKHGRKGPVWLDIPLDLQSASITPENLDPFEPPTVNSDSNESEIAKFVLSKIADSSKPLFLLGNNVRVAELKRLVNIIERFGIPVVFDSSAPDIYPSSEPLSIGSVGALGCSRAGNFTIQQADLVISLGSVMRTSLTGDDVDEFARNAEVIAIDVDDSQIRNELKSRIDFYSADLNTIVEELDKSEIIPSHTSWADQAKIWKESIPLEINLDNPDGIDLYKLSKALPRVIDDDAIIVADSGLAQLIVPTNTDFYLKQRMLHPFSQGAMGYALPAAVGAAQSSGKQVVVVTGDGSIMMNLQEFQTIAHSKLPVKTIVISNNAYAVIRRRQKELFRKRTIGTDSSNGVSCPDFSKVAHSFDLPYFKITPQDDLESELIKALSTQGPILCEIEGLDDQDYLKVSRAINSEGKMEVRSFDDLSPFLDREFLKSLIS